MVKMFKADKYPHHLVESKMKAYKPIILQVINYFSLVEFNLKTYSVYLF